MTDSTCTRKHGRAPLVLSGLALAVAIGGTGGPAIAAVIAANSDKVDGFHAVGSATKPAKRAGALVATDAKGQLPQNIVAPRLPAVLPPGATLRGAWGIEDDDATQAQSGTWGTTISFPVPLPDGMQLRLLGEAEITEDCPGPNYAPEAAPGFVCVYTSIGDSSSAPSGQMPTPYGASVWVNDDSSQGSVDWTGTWAATAPN
jgi:hypothetical protein